MYFCSLDIWHLESLFVQLPHIYFHQIKSLSLKYLTLYDNIELNITKVDKNFEIIVVIDNDDENILHLNNKRSINTDDKDTNEFATENDHSLNGIDVVQPVFVHSLRTSNAPSYLQDY